MQGWDLKKQLQALQKLFLGGSSTLIAFSHHIVDKMVEGVSLVDLSIADLQDSLETCIASSTEPDALPLLSRFEGNVLCADNLLAQILLLESY